MTREEWLARYLGTVWLGGKRYWRGQVMYQPTWAVRDLRYRPVGGWWGASAPPLAWFVELERLDDNSVSKPCGARQWLSLNNCFYGIGQYPEMGTYRQAVDARMEAVA
jgi:hypothetical protein